MSKNYHYNPNAQNYFCNNIYNLPSPLLAYEPNNGTHFYNHNNFNQFPPSPINNQPITPQVKITTPYNKNNYDNYTMRSLNNLNQPSELNGYQRRKSYNIEEINYRISEKKKQEDYSKELQKQIEEKKRRKEIEKQKQLEEDMRFEKGLKEYQQKMEEEIRREREKMKGKVYNPKAKIEPQQNKENPQVVIDINKQNDFDSSINGFKSKNELKRTIVDINKQTNEFPKEEIDNMKISFANIGMNNVMGSKTGSDFYDTQKKLGDINSNNSNSNNNNNNLQIQPNETIHSLLNHPKEKPIKILNQSKSITNFYFQTFGNSKNKEPQVNENDPYTSSVLKNIDKNMLEYHSKYENYDTLKFEKEREKIIQKNKENNLIPQSQDENFMGSLIGYSKMVKGSNEENLYETWKNNNNSNNNELFDTFGPNGKGKFVSQEKENLSKCGEEILRSSKSNFFKKQEEQQQPKIMFNSKKFNGFNLGGSDTLAINKNDTIITSKNNYNYNNFNSNKEFTLDANKRNKENEVMNEILMSRDDNFNLDTMQERNPIEENDNNNIEQRKEEDNEINYEDNNIDNNKENENENMEFDELNMTKKQKELNESYNDVNEDDNKDDNVNYSRSASDKNNRTFRSSNENLSIGKYSDTEEKEVDLNQLEGKLKEDEDEENKDIFNNILNNQKMKNNNAVIPHESSSTKNRHLMMFDTDNNAFKSLKELKEDKEFEDIGEYKNISDEDNDNNKD